MADLVLRRSEESLPEFEQMLRIGIFSADEVKAIMKKSLSHEYKLVRRVKVKEDFLACIQHKIHLLALIKKRRKRIGYFFKKDEIEFAIVSRIHGIFKQCTFRWPDDLQLWLSHIEFCKEWNKKIQLSKIWTAMLQLHGNANVSLWAMAAKWELEDNHSVENARQVFLRGIRHFPENPKLWQEYFRMELIHVMKTRQRLALLKEGEQHEEDLTEEYLRGKAAQIIYKNAIKAIPDDSKVKCGFLEIALLFSFFAGEIINAIVEDIMENHCSDPCARSTLAKLHLNPSVMNLDEKGGSSITQAADVWSAEKRCWEDFECAIDELNSSEIWEIYVVFLSERATKASSSEDKISLETASSDAYAEKRLEKLFSVLARGHEARKLTQECYIRYIDHLIGVGKAKIAIEVLSDCTKFLNSMPLSIRMLQLLTSGDHIGSDMNIVRDAIDGIASNASKLDGTQEKAFWMTWMGYAEKLADRNYAWKALKLAKKCKVSCLAEMAVSHLNWELQSSGAEKALEVYTERLQPLCARSFELLCAMSKILKRSSSDKSSATSCYENAMDYFGRTHARFWLDYISHLLATDPSKVGVAHWKAMKTLEPELIEEFSEGYSLLYNPR